LGTIAAIAYWKKHTKQIHPHDLLTENHHQDVATSATSMVTRNGTVHSDNHEATIPRPTLPLFHLLHLKFHPVHPHRLHIFHQQLPQLHNHLLPHDSSQLQQQRQPVSAGHYCQL
jgi:hypothetical protein